MTSKSPIAEHGNRACSIPKAEQSRSGILDEATARWIIAEARVRSPEFGLLVRWRPSPARVGQLTQLKVEDPQADREAPRLMMRLLARAKEKSSAPWLGADAARACCQAARPNGRSAYDDAVAAQAERCAVEESDHSRLFARAAKAASQDSRRS